MEKKRLLIALVIIAVIILLVTAPLISARITIQGILKRSVSLNCKYVSTYIISMPNFGWGAVVYTFKDENDVNFNVYYSHIRHYDSFFIPEKLFICNYHQIIFSEYLEEIETAFLKYLDPNEFSLKINDSSDIRSKKVGKLYDFRTYRYDIKISSDESFISAQARIKSAVTAAVEAAPDWQHINVAYYDDNHHNFARNVRQFDYSRFPSISFYYHDDYIGSAPFNPNDVHFEPFFGAVGSRD